MLTSSLKVALVALVSCALLAGCGGAQSRQARHISRGEQFMKDGNFEKARVEFRNALQISPDDAQARYLHGQAQERLGNLREAASMYQGAIDVDTNHAAARASLGRIFVFAGAPERALEYIDPGLVRHPDDPELLTARAAARMQLQDLESATADAQRALALAPDTENAVALLASIYRQQGKVGEAVSLVHGALERLPASVDLRQVLAVLYIQGGQSAQAEEQLRKVVAQKPAEIRHRYELANFLLREKRLDDAEQVMNEAVAAGAGEAAPKLALVEFIAAQRGLPGAEARLREFIADEKDDAELLLGLAALQERGGKSDEAIKTLQTIIDRAGTEPDGLAARNRMAAIHAQNRRFDAAVGLLDEVLKENPRDNDALLVRGNIALERQQPEAAIADLRAVLRDQPGAVGILRTLARAHLLNGEAALAEENLRTAVTAAPGDSAVAIELAQLLSGNGRAAQAVMLLENTVRKSPQDVPARAALVQAYVTNKDLKSAVLAVEDLRTLAPKASTAYYLAGLIAQAEGRLADSEREFESALERTPGAVDVLAALTRTLLATKRSAEAEARVRAVVTADGKNHGARNLLGELLLSRREFQGAAQEFSAIITASPGWWIPYRNLALTQLGTDDTAAALQTLQRGLAASGGEPALATDLAALHERLGKFDAAIQVYDDLHRRVPRSEFAANNLAMLLATYRKDAASLERAHVLTAGFATSTNPALLDTHAWVRLLRGDYNTALPVLERALRQAPESRVIRYHLATAQFKAGQREQAASNLKLALDGKAEFSGVEGARAMLAELRP